MHKCINNSIGNVYHLEQFVSDFFPYSQKQLGFDKPATIRFESDPENADVMLGKTAYYDPEAMEVVLYIDGRHPKDVMRSLSHELVHHAQNCRGDFTDQDNTGPGYAQEDPHLRKMEREAYTKGNLIFRDFEDLIKTEKINIEIDFSDSGEPKMSLKEWKDGEINTRLMKKWGFLKESKELVAEMHEGPHNDECGCSLEEGEGSYRDEDELEEAEAGAPVEPDSFVARTAADDKRGHNQIKTSGADLEAQKTLRRLELALRAGGTQNIGKILAALRIIDGELDKRDAVKLQRAGGQGPGSQGAGPTTTTLSPAKPPGASPTARAALTRAGSGRERKSPSSLRREGAAAKISIREAKNITRRIIARVKKENK